MGSSGEDFLLKWNDHHTLFFAGAEELCHSDEYTDCTLAAGHKFFSAHKLVLSICSPFFRSLFKRLGSSGGISGSKTVIFLKDIEPKHLELLLEYMYKGEIKVQESELVNVLNAAQSLEVKGLTDNGQKSSENAPTPPPPPKPAKPEGVSRLSHPTKRPSPTPNVHTEPSKRPKPIVLKPVSQPIAIAPAPPPAPPAVKEEQPEPQEVIPLNEEGQNWETGGEGGGGAGGGEVSAYGQDDYNDDGGYGGGDGGTVATGYEEIGGYEGGEEYYGDGEGVIAVGEGDDRVAVQMGQRGKGLTVCPYCIKDFKTPSLLQRHITVHTKEKKFVCACGRGYTRHDRYRKHVDLCVVGRGDSDMEHITITSVVGSSLDDGSP